MRKLVLVTVGLCLILGGCMMPEPDPSYSFTDPRKPYYPTTERGARLFIADARSSWYYVYNDYVQAPAYSYAVMSGDCDDFAVMLAGYLKEHWGYSTYVLLLYSEPRDTGHAVCVIQRSQFPLGSYEQTFCTTPLVTIRGETYYPLDFSVCAGWDWSDYTIGLRIRSLIDGRFYVRDALRWDDCLNYKMDVPKPAGG